jgi:hypothetical protein
VRLIVQCICISQIIGYSVVFNKKKINRSGIRE